VGMRNDTMSRRQDIYRDAVAVIRQNYATDLTVQTVAHAIGTSRRQLQRVFEEVGGASFRTVLTRVRMENASVLLRETDAPVATVARQVGYSQPAQFAKTFRRLHGAAPSAYRTSPRPRVAASHPLGAAARRPETRHIVGLGQRANVVQVATNPL
jgi:AraC family transcriptional regulator, regulatory protein of adaptative response / methylphosphotriester-DNA alkyltransferase methyltransferase